MCKIINFRIVQLFKKTTYKKSTPKLNGFKILKFKAN